MKILLVEDSKFLSLATAQVLTRAGHSVNTAKDGEEGIRVTRETQPDLVLLDMMLPKLGGEHVLRALRQDPATARIPVVVLSGLSQSNANKLKEAGATAYIEKAKLDLTGTGEDLLRLVDAALRKAKARVVS